MSYSEKKEDATTSVIKGYVERESVRVLVTGSRNWGNCDFIEEKMKEITEPGSQMVLIEGGCPTGADRIARLYATGAGWKVETCKADWNNFGKAEGPIRNKKMVYECEPDHVLGFCIDNSKGTMGTIAMAKKRMKDFPGTIKSVECHHC